MKMWPSEAWWGAGLKKNKKQLPTEKENRECNGNGLGSLDSALGFWQTIPGRLHNGFGWERVVWADPTQSHKHFLVTKELQGA
jgi:hypothetical protein